MLELDAADFMWIGSVLRHLVMEMEAAGQILPMAESYAKAVSQSLVEVAARCKLLELPVSEKTANYWNDRFAKADVATYLEGRCGIEEIERVIKNELSDMPLFFMSKERMSEHDKMFEEVKLLYDRPWPIALTNLDSARFCYVYEEFTASVFHSMRAVEKILTTVADSLTGVDLSREQWQTLIERIESEIKKLDALSKGADREKKQTFCSEIAMQFRYIKNAWRNHVMHGRTTYKEKEAREIWWHVKRMVEQCCEEMPELLET